MKSYETRVKALERLEKKIMFYDKLPSRIVFEGINPETLEVTKTVIIEVHKGPSMTIPGERENRYSKGIVR